MPVTTRPAGKFPAHVRIKRYASREKKARTVAGNHKKKVTIQAPENKDPGPGRTWAEKSECAGRECSIRSCKARREGGNARPIKCEIFIDFYGSGRPYVLKERLRQRRKGQKHGEPFSFLVRTVEFERAEPGRGFSRSAPRPTTCSSPAGAWTRRIFLEAMP